MMILVAKEIRVIKKNDLFEEYEIQLGHDETYNEDIRVVIDQQQAVILVKRLYDFLKTAETKREQEGTRYGDNK